MKAQILRNVVYNYLFPILENAAVFSFLTDNFHSKL